MRALSGSLVSIGTVDRFISKKSNASLRRRKVIFPGGRRTCCFAVDALAVRMLLCLQPGRMTVGFLWICRREHLFSTRPGAMFLAWSGSPPVFQLSGTGTSLSFTIVRYELQIFSIVLGC